MKWQLVILVITGSTIQIAAMGDDATTDEIDGLTNDTELIWMVWDCNLETIYSAVTSYSNGPSNFVVNGLSFIESITVVPPGPSEQLLLCLQDGLISQTYMSPENMDIGDFLSPIITDVIIAKNNLGLAYLPEWDFNGIGDLQVGQGYQVKLSNANELLVTGEYMTPEDNPINLTAGWNMIGYLRTDEAAADAVLADLSSSGNLVIASDCGGNAYLPEWNFNGIGDMVPGEAYQLKINNADVFSTYQTMIHRMSALEVTENSVSHFANLLLQITT